MAGERPGGHLERPGSGILHPVAIGAIVVLALNDQWLKTAWPGPLTWLASDVAGLIVAPLALQAVWEIGAWSVGRWQGPNLRVLAASIAVVGIGFVAVQVWPPATDLYRDGLGTAQWPFRAIAAVLAGAPIPGVAPVQAVGDVGDLLALPALAVTWWLGRRRVDRAEDRAVTRTTTPARAPDRAPDRPAAPPAG